MITLKMPNVRKYRQGMIETAGMHRGWFERIEPSFGNILDSFVRSLEGESVALPTLWDGLRAQQIAEAAFKSLHTNQPVQIEYWMP
jgi:myo-inositol 2-dehydrogenase/D-chiro-inositol 1-dehydrogenase